MVELPPQLFLGLNCRPNFNIYHINLVPKLQLGNEKDEDNAMKVENEREDDGRWIAEIPAIPGVMAYGENRNEAVSKAEALALRVMADRLE
jgi:hypothetical protein